MKLLTFSTDADSARRLGVHLTGNTIADVPATYRRHFDAEAPACFDSVNNLLQGGDDALTLARDVYELANSSSDDESQHDADSIIFHPPAGDRAKISGGLHYY